MSRARSPLVVALAPVLFPVLAPAIVLSLASVARGHGEPIGGLSPFVDGQGSVIGAGTTWGVVLQDGDGWLRSCEEGPGAPARFYHRTTDGRVLVAGDAGLLVTDDGGCTYAPPAGDLGEQQIGAFAVAGSASARIVVGTQNAGRDNGVYVSTDAGRSFTATPLVREGIRFDSLLVSADGLVVVAHAQDFTSFEGKVFVSKDGGASFEEGPAALEGYPFVRLLSVGEDGVTLAAAGALEGGGNALLLSTDGFDTAVEIARFDDEVTAYGDVNGHRFAALSRTRLFRQEADGEPFILVEGPRRCLVRAPGDTRLFGCGQLPEGAHLLATADGVTWEPHVPFLGVRERLCPKGTPGYDRCEQYIFPDAGPVPEPGDAGTEPDVDGGTKDDGPLCACTTTGEGRALSALLGLFALVVFPRRRGRRA